MPVGDSWPVLVMVVFEWSMHFLGLLCCNDVSELTGGAAADLQLLLPR